MKWYKIASQRVNSTWWDSVLAPLRNLESGATGGVVHSRTNQISATEANMNDSFVPTRNSIEDVELETRALTEPLPTNQQVASEVTLANMLFDIVDSDNIFHDSLSLCRPTKIMHFMSSKNGLQSTKYFIQRVRFWGFVQVTLFTLGLVCKLL